MQISEGPLKACHHEVSLVNWRDRTSDIRTNGQYKMSLREASLTQELRGKCAKCQGDVRLESTGLDFKWATA